MEYGTASLSIINKFVLISLLPVGLVLLHP
jgi:hypothetical protein